MVAQLIWSAYINVMDQRTDGQTDDIRWHHPPIQYHGAGENVPHISFEEKSNR